MKISNLYKETSRKVLKNAPRKLKKILLPEIYRERHWFISTMSAYSIIQGEKISEINLIKREILLVID